MTRALHEKIICQKPVLLASGAGEQNDSWQDIAEVWAAATRVSDRPETEARQTRLTTSYRLLMRHQDILEETRRILWRGKIYQVTGMGQPDARGRMLEITVREELPT
tara:strand:+ start:128 stop:448 length:321 start_codon:yes stop_codon:yes gene_type:complete